MLGALREYLDEISESYKTNFNLNFVWDIQHVVQGKLEHQQDLPKYATELIKKALEFDQVAYYNVRGNTLRKNFLVSPFYFNGGAYIIILSSYSMEFGDTDGWLIQLLHRVLLIYAEGIEFGMLVDNGLLQQPTQT